MSEREGVSPARMNAPPSGPETEPQVSAPGGCAPPRASSIALRLRTGGLHGDAFAGTFAWAGDDLRFQNDPVARMERKALYRDGGSVDVKVTFADGRTTVVGVPRDEAARLRASGHALLRAL